MKIIVSYYIEENACGITRHKYVAEYSGGTQKENINDALLTIKNRVESVYPEYTALVYEDVKVR